VPGLSNSCPNPCPKERGKPKPARVSPLSGSPGGHAPARNQGESVPAVVTPELPCSGLAGAKCAQRPDLTKGDPSMIACRSRSGGRSLPDPQTGTCSARTPWPGDALAAQNQGAERARCRRAPRGEGAHALGLSQPATTGCRTPMGMAPCRRRGRCGQSTTWRRRSARRVPSPPSFCAQYSPGPGATARSGRPVDPRARPGHWALLTSPNIMQIGAGKATYRLDGKPRRSLPPGYR
jgi:hypothetical protein